ncbi:type II secretion system protein [Catenuloplanes sp. NPDC051500]|uniref:type II secretion system protein n=1 Tax=Catenuloplanes sp. NPDC051500 TaxID=3363959 RepID=UPI0037A35D47
MQHLIAKSQQKRAESDKGFTLIELLVVVVIIGILVAIAVPVYLNYRKGASNKSAQSDVRGAVSAVEQYYTENGNTYPATNAASTAGTSLTFAATTTTGGTTTTTGTPQTATVSAGNVLHYTLTAATATAAAFYVLCGQNADGLKIYVYNSKNGGSVKESTQTTLAACDTNGN